MSSNMVETSAVEATEAPAEAEELSIDDFEMLFSDNEFRMFTFETATED